MDMAPVPHVVLPQLFNFRLSTSSKTTLIKLLGKRLFFFHGLMNDSMSATLEAAPTQVKKAIGRDFP